MNRFDRGPGFGGRRAVLLSLALLAWLPFTALGCAADASGHGEEDGEIASQGAALSERSLGFEVSLRGATPVKIHARVWEGGARGGATVLAIHGLSETGAVFGPLATTILEDRALRRRVRRVIAVDMPGHGQSGVPAAESGLKFGDLQIEDNVTVVIESIRKLRSQGLAPSVLIGHSMGGLEVQAAQETLLAQRSSLARLGIRRALLIAPVPPHGRQWTQSPPSDITPFIVDDPALGTYLQFPPIVFIAQSFGKLDGTLASNAPSEADVVAEGYMAPEPLGLLLQLVEAPVELPDGTTIMLQRPGVREGAFRVRNGTLLELASFSQDVLIAAGDLAMLYPYLTNDPRNRLYTPVVADDATHSMFLSNPDAVLDAIRTL